MQTSPVTSQNTPTAAGSIRIRGARTHNLRNVDVDIPHDRLVVVTGVSGCGKSSLVFDTLFAEGERRYLESLSAYTRQFLSQMQRPDVDAVDGLPPTISVEQRARSTGRRSTLATVTEIHDYLRVLYARAGLAHCPQCGRPLTQQSTQAIVDQILALPERRKVMILAPLVRGRKGAHREVFERISREGFVRARVDGAIVDLSEPPALAKSKPHDVEVVIDRILVKDGLRDRLQESVDLALKHGDGTCLISAEADGKWDDRLFSSRLACPDCQLNFAEIEPRTFSFNSPYGACPECQGLGFQRRPESEKNEPPAAERPVCPACHGARLGPIGRSVTILEMTLPGFTAQTVTHAENFVQRLERAVAEPGETDGLPPAAQRVARTLLPDIAQRLRFLRQVGLDYLTLDRSAATLSGGEFQRARLAGCLGSGLTGVCYVLDEPTIGLHDRDTKRLLNTLEELRDQGNTVVVVEHDTEVMRQADFLLDLGPGAGAEGGRLVAEGTPDDVARHSESVTGHYLSHQGPVFPAATEAKFAEHEWLSLTGARVHNLQNVTLRVPLGALTAVTGVSGSGKTSLIAHTLVPAVRTALAGQSPQGAPYESLRGIESIDRLAEVDQSPLGRSLRSTPATYSGVWDEIRRVFAKTREARLRGYSPRRFSFNAKEGRCEECAGQGLKRIEMRFLPDMFVECPRCRGARFNRPTLSVRFRGKSVADVLSMRIDEAAEFFTNFQRLRSTLVTFTDVGLGYLTLGQPAQTLSGGEAQRVKLAAELHRTPGQHTLFVLDEPTTGLHPADVVRLIDLLKRLVDQGNTVLVVEHQLDLIAAADWVIDLGPDGGTAGGRIVAEGLPAEVASTGKGFTATALRRILARAGK